MSESQQTAAAQVSLEGPETPGPDKSIQASPKVYLRQSDGGYAAPINLDVEAPVSEKQPGRHDSWFTRARIGRQVVAADTTPSVLRNPSRRQLESTDELFGPNAARAARTIMVATVTWGYAPIYSLVRRNWVKMVRGITRSMFFASGLSSYTQDQLHEILLTDLDKRRAYVRERHAKDAEVLEREKNNMKELGIDIQPMLMAEITEQYPYESLISQQTLLLLKEIDRWAQTRAQIYALGVYGKRSVMQDSVKKSLLAPYWEHLRVAYDLFDKVKASAAELRAAAVPAESKGARHESAEGRTEGQQVHAAVQLARNSNDDATLNSDPVSAAESDAASSVIVECGQEAA